MNDADFQLHDSIEEDHWWFVGKRLILRALLDERPTGGRMLDLGCGTGGVLRDWQSRNRCFGVDRSRLALKMCARRGFDWLACGDLERIPLQARSVDTVLILDVIEHLDHDVDFLRAAAELCRPEGRLVISVPAFNMLWSQHDEAFQHRRRYSARELRTVIERAGLIVERTTYTNMLVFPVAAVWRILSYRLGLGRFAPKNDFWPVPRWLNQLLTLQYRFEARLLRHLDLPFGVSVLCIARPAD
jgi:SAM-dependent methyltransferase